MSGIDRSYLSPIDFDEVNKVARSFADHIESNFEKIADILLEYESFEVVQDEVGRTLDLLRNLIENKKYFSFRIGSVTTFLPRNQPLYAFACFVIIPSLMARDVHFRIPHTMRDFFPSLLTFLDVRKSFPNIVVSNKQRLEFLRERSALLINPITKETIPVTDVVIFTGIPRHADQLRLIFDKRTLFISNGAGHNPVVVSNDADIPSAVEAVLTLQLYNQGQDCAAPNAILVHKANMRIFLDILREKLKGIKVGHYRDKRCRVGPIGRPDDLVRIQNFLVEHRKWLDASTPGIIFARDAIIEPTIVLKKLKDGGNFSEIFAPIIFIQEYKEDSDLAYYFEDERYESNAMYVTIYGTSSYVDNLLGRRFQGRILHDKSTILRNIHLHAPGIERGIKPYGGYGCNASSLKINGNLICKPTLPQRDIFEHIIKPIPKEDIAARQELGGFSQLVYKNVEKLLRLKPSETPIDDKLPNQKMYIDLGLIKTVNNRYAAVDDGGIYHLLRKPNAEHISALGPSDVQFIRLLRKLLSQKNMLTPGDFKKRLYDLTVSDHQKSGGDRLRQRNLFLHVYSLLFNRKSGPNLSTFLWEIDNADIMDLLDV